MLSAILPEQRILIQTDRGTRRVRLGSGAQAGLLAAFLALGGWFVYATADVAVDVLAADAAAGPTVALNDAYRDRLDELVAERDARAAEARAAQARFQAAMDRIGRQQAAILEAVEGTRELESALAIARGRIDETGAARDAALAENARLAAQAADARTALADAPAGADLSATLGSVTDALTDAVEARDAAEADRQSLTAELAASRLELRLTTRRQDEMIGQLRDAVADSTGPLEKALTQAGLDVDSVLATIRPQFSGQGGPLVPIGVSSRSYPGDDKTIGRFDELMVDVDRMNLLKVALGRVPYAMPVTAAHRFTSPFGYRRDPKGMGRRMHAGIDLAAPQGTPIYAAADGVVVSAEMESGYGLAVRIKHDFGFETLYAHQSKLRVKAGDRVSRGDRIGDMGRTGRVTGVHLHYEVRQNGGLVNPMTYVEAAKDVF